MTDYTGTDHTEQEHPLAIELEVGLDEALEEEKRGELVDLDDMIRELGFSPAEFNPGSAPEE